MNSRSPDKVAFDSLDDGLERLKASSLLDSSDLEDRIIQAAPITTQNLVNGSAHRSKTRWSLNTVGVAASTLAFLLLFGVYSLLVTPPNQVDAGELAIAEIEFEELWLMDEQLHFDELSALTDPPSLNRGDN